MALGRVRLGCGGPAALLQRTRVRFLVSCAVSVFVFVFVLLLAGLPCCTAAPSHLSRSSIDVRNRNSGRTVKLINASAEGDLVVFTDLVTGAGEFEGF